MNLGHRLNIRESEMEEEVFQYMKEPIRDRVMRGYTWEEAVRVLVEKAPKNPPEAQEIRENTKTSKKLSTGGLR